MVSVVFEGFAAYTTYDSDYHGQKSLSRLKLTCSMTIMTHLASIFYIHVSFGEDA